MRSPRSRLRSASDDTCEATWGGRLPCRARQDALQHRPADDRGQKVVEHDPLVVPAYEALDGVEVRVGSVQEARDAVVEAEERGVQLGHDHVLVVAGVADEGPLGVAWRG